MELNTGRIGPLFSDRLVLGEGGFDSLRVDDSLWSLLIRIISWIFAPSNYTEENQRTVACVRRYFVDQLGEERLNRICQRYDIKLETDGSPLLSRELAMILTGIKDVKVDDVDGLIQLAGHSMARWPTWIPRELRWKLASVPNSGMLDSATFAKVVEVLSVPPGSHSVPELPDPISGGMPTETYGKFFFDPFLADRERLSLVQENKRDQFETFVHNFVARILAREMDVGMLIPAPNHPTGRPQFYRVSAKIVTGEGMVSYVLAPATRDTNLKTIRFYRGTMARPSALDAASTVITDLEAELGRTSHDSGKIYGPLLKRVFGPIEVAAGHSLGSTQLQYDAVDNSDLRTIYLYNGPGLPPEEVDRFNERMSRPDSAPLHVVIRDSSADSVSSMGKVHLGFEAPEDKVTIDYREYYPLHDTGAGHAHVMVPHHQHRIYGIEGGHTREQLNSLLDHRTIDSFECVREALGPIVAKVIEVIRDFCRWLFGSRTYQQLGIQIGKYEGGRWTVRHHRPEHIPHLRL